jgi:CBS domain-containing protein
MLRMMRERGVREWNAPMISRNRVSVFPLAFLGEDSATVTHPTRGTMVLTVHADGGLRTLDARATTRGLIVTEGEGLDIDALTKSYAARDAAGRGVGVLSGRDTTRATVVGAEMMVEFGTPVRRGREIWGGLVKYGKLWRTGANRATHFTTNKTLRFDELEVPPGEYTLFSIPEGELGVLIINKQTGQNGQRYDEAQDLGRVAMYARPISGTVEVFTIRIDELAGEGLIRLQWHNTEYVAEFEVVQ